MFYFRYTVGNLVIRESYTSNRIQVKNTVYILRYLLFYLLFDGFEAIFRTGYLITTLVPSLSLNYHRVANQDIRRFILLSAHLIDTNTHAYKYVIAHVCLYYFIYSYTVYAIYCIRFVTQCFLICFCREVYRFILCYCDILFQFTIQKR